MSIGMFKIYRHKKNKQKYQVMSRVKVKNLDGGWDNGVAYQAYPDDFSSTTYVRTEGNFKDRFDEVLNGKEKNS